MVYDVADPGGQWSSCSTVFRSRPGTDGWMAEPGDSQGEVGDKLDVLLDRIGALERQAVGLMLVGALISVVADLLKDALLGRG